jgi:hypothetical protein
MGWGFSSNAKKPKAKVRTIIFRRVMAGFLDPKTRFLDTILTVEGRRQLAEGRLRAEFYSFSDATAIYVEDTIVSGSLEGIDRPQLEAASLPQDTITFEADDSGRLISKTLANSLFGITSSTLFVAPGQIMIEVSGTQEAMTGQAYLSQMDTLLGSSLQNYKRCRILGSPELIDQNRDEFILGPLAPESFIITDNNPIPEADLQEIEVNQIEGFFQDKRLSHIANFKFLPPVNKRRLGDTNIEPLGTYDRIDQAPILTIEELENELAPRINHGYKRTFFFTETSKKNRFFAQFFEVGEDGETRKLDVIDFGSFPGKNSVARRVFFAGKVYTDDFGVDTFVNMFTLILS